MRAVDPGATLVKDHNLVEFWVEESPAPRRAPGTWTAVQKDGRHTVWIAGNVVIQLVAIAHIQQAALVWLNLRIELCWVLDRGGDLIGRIARGT